MSSTVLSIEGLSFGYSKEKSIYSNFSLSIDSGELVALVGPSGSGKSTLFDLIGGLLKPRSGEIRAERTAYIFQDPLSSFHPGYTIAQQIADVARLPMDRELLHDRLSLDPVLLDAKPYELSGGQLQRLSIYRALLMDPQLILADEPTSALDNLVQLETMKLLVGLLDRCAILLITHDEDLATWCANRVVRLEALS